jgi:hypothetical protein
MQVGNRPYANGQWSLVNFQGGHSVIFASHSNPKSYGQLPKSYWTRRVNLAYVSAYRGPLRAAEGADDCHAQILQPATGCPLGQPAPDASQPNPHHSAHPFSGAHAGAVAVRYRIHRNANALHRHGCEGRKFDRNRGWWLPVRSWRAGSQEAPTSTAGGSPQGLLSRAVQQRQQNEAHPATSSPASNVD